MHFFTTEETTTTIMMCTVLSDDGVKIGEQRLALRQAKTYTDNGQETRTPSQKDDTKIDGRTPRRYDVKKDRPKDGLMPRRTERTDLKTP